MNQVVISLAIDDAISKYIKYKDTPNSVEYNNFYVVVIRLLCIIYDEVNVITPYMNKDVKQFDKNITKYGYELDKLIDFKNQLDAAFDATYQGKFNPYFINIQKILIDMLMTKKDVTDISSYQVEQFYKTLYTPENKNPLQISELFLNAIDVWEIDSYFKDEMTKHSKVDVEKPKVLLNPEVYPIFGLTFDKVKTMSADYIDLLNHQIYLHFGIKENDINKDLKLERAITKYKINNKVLTSGNGYVDILLLIGVLSTLGLLLTIGVFALR